MLLVTHGLSVAYQYSYYVVCPSKPNICCGRSDEVLTPESLRNLYCGEIINYQHLIAIIVALGVKMVGGLLTAALVAIPASTSRNLSRNVSHYILGAVLIGSLSSCVGIFISAFTISCRSIHYSFQCIHLYGFHFFQEMNSA
jgi:hypothetical protein